jgi:hypothetical protein
MPVTWMDDAPAAPATLYDVVCAWCKRYSHKGPVEGSHTLCKDCELRLMPNGA